MSSSDLAKIGLVNFYSDIGSNVSDWKRTRKANGIREFTNIKAGIIAIIDDERLDEYEGGDGYLYCHEGGDMLFSIHEDAVDGLSIMFVAKSYWDREQCFPDQHWGHVIHAAYDIPMHFLDEVMENTFVPENFNGDKQALIDALETYGVKHAPELELEF